MAETTGSGSGSGEQTAGEGSRIDSVAFYRRPEPIAVERHGKLGVKRIKGPFTFAQTTHVTPITVGEFGSAGLDYPIIFAGPEHVPLAVLGLRPGQNLFVNETGEYEKHRYVPAFIRRYPFVFAEDRDNDRFIACIDVEAPMVAENAEIPLFEGQEPSQFTREAIDFLSAFEQQRRETQNFVARLDELDLFHKAKLSVTPTQLDGTRGEPVTVVDYIAISMDKVNALAPQAMAELRDSGHLAAIYVHAHSLRTWPNLMQRASERAAGAATSSPSSPAEAAANGGSTSA